MIVTYKEKAMNNATKMAECQNAADGYRELYDFAKKFKILKAIADWALDKATYNEELVHMYATQMYRNVRMHLLTE